MNIGRVCKIIKDEGIRTFCYLLKEKTDARTGEDQRYKKYLEKDEPLINKKYLEDCATNHLEIVLWDEHSTIETIKNAVKKCTCDYVGLQQADMILHKDAKTIINSYIEKQEDRNVIPDVIYGNEDYLDAKNTERSNPIFRPEYSPDTLWSYNYIGNFACIRKEVLMKCMDELDEMWNQQTQILYFILLTLSLREDIRFHVIHTILAHRVLGNEHENNGKITGNIKQQILNTHGIEAEVKNDRDAHGACSKIHYVDYAYHKELISIIIPSKDNPTLLGKCIESIQENTKHATYEIILVDNGSSREHQVGYEKVLGKSGVTTKYIYQPMDFNFAKMCNMGATQASGSILLFLNDDIEIQPQNYCTQMNKDWLEILAGQAIQKQTGAVGAKLMYPGSNKLQHIGVVNYENAGLAHIYGRSEDDGNIKDYRNKAVYNYLCVTGACLMVENSKFKQVNGFNEGLAVTHNDVDLCFHLYKEGYRQVQRNDVVLIHHESFSRGIDEENKEKELRNMKERDFLYSLYPEYERWDPYYSPCLAQLEFDSRINPEIYSIIYEKPVAVTEQLESSSRVLQGKITSAQYREDLQIYGYVFDEKGSWMNPTIVIYNDEHVYKITAKSLCDRVFHERKGINRHVNFAPFYCGVNTTNIEKGIYAVRICDNQNRIVGDGIEIRIANKK